MRTGKIIFKFISFSVLFIAFQNVNAERFAQTLSEFDAYKQQVSTGFEEYKKQLQKGFDKYKKETSKIWGNKNNPVDDKAKWVSYQGDINHRSIVDFEKGTVEVEFAIPVSDNLSDSDAKRELEKTIINTLKQGADKRSIIEIAKQPVAKPTGASILKNQVADDHGNLVTVSNYEKLASSLIRDSKKKMVKGSDGKSRTVFTAQFKLIPDHIRKRAVSYKGMVEENAREQKLPIALIYAIMETESMFNPTARSHTPAFGLMQLVPTTGARDAYRYLYNQDRVVKDSYLYKPNNNIRLGSAYLNRLYYGYFKNVKNKESRLWVTIAAYNTGMGVVYKAFAGNKSKSRMGGYKKWKKYSFDEMNRRSPEQVYQFLRKNLGNEEGREYVRKVRSKMPKYQSV